MRLEAIFLIGAAITAQPLVNPDVLEPSVQNEVDHALSRVPVESMRQIEAMAKDPARCRGQSLDAANKAFMRIAATNGLSATDQAIRLVSMQRSDGRWLSGTNDVTVAAALLLTILEDFAR